MGNNYQNYNIFNNIKQQILPDQYNYQLEKIKKLGKKLPEIKKMLKNGIVYSIGKIIGGESKIGLKQYFKKEYNISDFSAILNMQCGDAENIITFNEEYIIKNILNKVNNNINDCFYIEDGKVKLFFDGNYKITFGTTLYYDHNIDENILGKEYITLIGNSTEIAYGQNIKVGNIDAIYGYYQGKFKEGDIIELGVSHNIEGKNAVGISFLSIKNY